MPYVTCCNHGNTVTMATLLGCSVLLMSEMLLKLVFALLLAHFGECRCKLKPTVQESAVLELHNQYRRLHQGTPDLCYGKSGDKVTYTAQSWSRKMLQENRMSHSDGKYGENLWWGQVSLDFSRVDAYNASVSNWYNEIENWHFETSTKIDPSRDALHFTQVVWVRTTEVNCGFAQKHEVGTFVTCQYHPRGNYATTEARRNNVRPLSFVPDPTEGPNPTLGPDPTEGPNPTLGPDPTGQEPTKIPTTNVTEPPTKNATESESEIISGGEATMLLLALGTALVQLLLH